MKETNYFAKDHPFHNGVEDFKSAKISGAEFAAVCGMKRPMLYYIMKTYYPDVMSARGATLAKSLAKSRKKKLEKAKAAETRRYGSTVAELQKAFGDIWKIYRHQYSMVKGNVVNAYGKSAWQLSYAEWLDHFLGNYATEVDAHPGERICLSRIDQSMPYSRGNVHYVAFSDLSKATRAKHSKKVTGQQAIAGAVA